MQRMKESETAKEYTDRLLGVVNKVRFLDTTINDSRIVQKILVSMPERYEAYIKDLSKITLVELLSAL